MGMAQQNGLTLAVSRGASGGGETHQWRLLLHPRDLTTEGTLVSQCEIRAVEEHAAAVGRVEAQREREDGALARAAAADKGYTLARRNCQ